MPSTASRPRYGPHDPTGVPETVRIYRGTRNPATLKRYGPLEEVDVPLPPALVRQREQLNTIAYLRSLEADRDEGEVVEAPPVSPQLRAELARYSDRCSNGFDYRRQHPQLCRCGERP